MSSGKIMLGVAAGVAAGAVLGVLFAPARGSATRKSIARKGIDGSENVQENLNDYIDATTEAYENIKKGALDLVDKGKETASSVAGAIRRR
jgi:gas vesicle protein